MKQRSLTLKQLLKLSLSLLLLIIVITLTACGTDYTEIRQVPGPKGDQGDVGHDGQDGKDGKDGQDGMSGRDGIDGQTGAQGPAGVDGQTATVVQLCPGTTSYPGIFIEVALCINNELYGVYSANGGFLTKLTQGNYYSNGIGSACNFTVLSNCQIEGE